MVAFTVLEFCIYIEKQTKILYIRTRETSTPPMSTEALFLALRSFCALET